MAEAGAATAEAGAAATATAAAGPAVAATAAAGAAAAAEAGAAAAAVRRALALLRCAATEVPRRALAMLLCAAAVFAAGCHNNNLDSGYGIAWVSLTDQPGDFTSYIVNVDSITLTRNDGAVVTALQTVETVDFAKLGNREELWGTATIPIGTYTSASIILDYTNADISVMVGGLPQKATVVNTTGAAVTTVTINVILDPANPLVIAPTYATTAAQRLAIDFNLAASTKPLNTATNPVTVTVEPYLTVAIAPPDDKPIRIRGPLINSSVNLGTYTVYVRPFYDEADSLGALSIFTNANTLFTINGVVSKGTPGITQLSQSSAGTTVTAAYVTYQPTATPVATAGVFTANYVIAGSTLEDVYTVGLEGDVIARSGNTLTLIGSTLQVVDNGSNIDNTIYIPSVYAPNALVVVGPGTTVTADDSTLAGLNYNDIAVGQHIVVRGKVGSSNLLPGANNSTVISVDATGNSETNTGSVRLLPTQLWGSLAGPVGATLPLNLQYINNWPVADYTFAGNGTSAATVPVPTAFSVDTGGLTLPAGIVPSTPLWIDGRVAPFGAAPPDFIASAVYNELGVQTAGAAAGGTACGQGNADCVPASMRVVWSGAGTATPFTTPASGTGPVVNLTNASTAVIRIGPESINLLAPAPAPAIVNPQIVATAAPLPVTAKAPGAGSVEVTLPPLFLPSYSFGNPLAVAPLGLQVFSNFSTFNTDLSTAAASTPATQLEARGTYNRASNTFTAISIAVVL
jgi:hypothetical protein